MTMHRASHAPQFVRWSRAILVSILIQGALLSAAPAADPLPSWNGTATKAEIIAFVDGVTDEGGADFVPVSERIAVFDNDGTLWAEQPLYFQLAFALDRVEALAPQYPEWQNQEPFKSILAGDTKTALAGGEKAVGELIVATHSGMTTDEFDAIVAEWIATARHPVTGRPYTEMVYQPMLELLAYLRANGFKTYIVSGGGIDFMRVFSERVYGIPTEQVIGSSGVTEFQMNDGIPVIMRMPEIGFIDDKGGKPVAIQRFIGRRPIAAFGNSDGDLQMLQWVTAGEGPRLGLIVHHTDAAREWAYDRDSSIGHLEQALDAATQQDWVVVDMRDDWRTIYPTE